MIRATISIAAWAVGLLGLVACVQVLRSPVEVAPRELPVSYQREVRPILDKRCAVCHSCYNGPCQLKLTSFEGLDRGGSKIPVYLSSRLRPQAPTRLFLDAHTTQAWRDKGFYSVTDSVASSPMNDSILLHVLDAKRQHPTVKGSYEAEASDLTCAAGTGELSRFLELHPDRGMPFGFPPLPEEQVELIASWLYQGANGPSPAEQAALTSPSPAAAVKIAKWEAFLNHRDAKHQMTARYLYEHFFLAHLSFSDADRTQFFELVRSKTPPGEPIEVIATVRPYDAPGVDDVYYRFRKIHSTIVYKTHMVVELTDAVHLRIEQLFIETPWLEPPYVVAFGDKTGANPFLVYAQIPPRVRYEFLLDHSEYMIRTFIRGPVCKGQIALNVIHDHFWVFFLDPDADQGVLRPRFLIEQADNLRLPTERGSSETVFKTFSDDYRARYSRFYAAKRKLLEIVQPAGLGLEDVWSGRRASDTPALTIYRHFDSASVHEGLHGGLPRTAWVIDYAQFERIYYALVAGFDVFGNLSHQVNVRRYMDYLRMEGELNFLHFMPKAARFEMLKSWYIGDGAVDETTPEAVLGEVETRVVYRTDDPKREFVEQLVDHRLLKSTEVAFDNINYHRAGSPPPEMPKTFETEEDIRNGLRALTAPGTAFIRHFNESDINLFHWRIRDFEGEDHFVSIVINRWHDNVNSLFGEASTLDSSKDTIDFLDGSVGAYPNYYFVVDGEDLPDFFDVLENYDGSPGDYDRLGKYAVDRWEDGFWETYDWFQSRLEQDDPLRAGLYDLNRYYPHADGPHE